MATTLPRFGELVDRLRTWIQLAHASAEIAGAKTALSAGTLRNIASGSVVKEVTWDDYAAHFVDGLLKSGLFPLQQAHRDRLLKSFHCYRSSYEQLNELLSRIQVDREILHRAVVRLQFLDLGIRYAALCLWTESEPSRAVPLWAKKQGANEFWGALVEKRFPGLALVGGKEVDCASKVQMTTGQMKHCLYDNAYPGSDCLKRLAPDAPEYAAALRHYCAYRICRELVDHFGEHEVECWVRNMVCVGACFVDFIKSQKEQVPEHQLRNLLWSMFSGGIGSTGVAEFVRRFAAGIPGLDLFCADLLAMANNEPLASVHEYVAVCSQGDKPEGLAWEQEFLNYMVEFRAFQRTGRFPDGWTPSVKLLLVRLLMEAGKKRDFSAMEHVLTRILANYPQDAEAHQLYAQLLERTERQELAWEVYERAAALDSGFQLPLFSLADSKSRAGQHEEALTVVDRMSGEGVGRGSRPFIRAICLIRARKFIDVTPLLIEAYDSGYEPGTCACVLFWFFGRFAGHSHESSKQQKRWGKVARHHGMPVERVLADLELG